jgi:hypothetical protein
VIACLHRLAQFQIYLPEADKGRLLFRISAKTKKRMTEKSQEVFPSGSGNIHSNQLPEILLTLINKIAR